jgi:hypothetical protein
MPDLNWELWRLRLSDEVARHLQREAAARAQPEKGTTMNTTHVWSLIEKMAVNASDPWRSVERDGDRQLRRKGRDLADAVHHVKDQLGSLARISDADESRRGLVRRALSQAGDLTTTLDALAGEGTT